jgi:hypothetical protein
VCTSSSKARSQTWSSISSAGPVARCIEVRDQHVDVTGVVDRRARGLRRRQGALVGDDLRTARAKRSTIAGPM